jgi:large repetitive protein
VTFTLLNGATPVGTATSTSGFDSNGNASVGYSLPAGLAGGSYIIDAAYSDSAGNFVASGDTTHTLTVNAAMPALTVSDAGGTYNGGAFAATATVAGVVAGVDDTPAATLEGVAPTTSYYSGAYTSPDQLAGLTPLAGAPVNAGSYTVLVAFPGSADYSGGQALANFTIAQATPSITWADPAAITAGTLLSATQLNATANVPGTFAYTPDVGAFLAAGSHTLALTFTPDDAANYQSVSASVPLRVDPAPLSGGASPAAHPAAPVATAGDSGLGHGDTQASSVPGSPTLTGSGTTASVPGTPSVTPSAPSVLAVRLNSGRPRGRGHSLSVVFSTLVQLDAGAFRLRRGRQALRLQVLTQAADGRTVATLAWRGPRVGGGVRPGGNYRLAIAADRVRADGLTLTGASVFVLRHRAGQFPGTRLPG